MPFQINKETQLCISIASRPGNFGATVHNAAFQATGLNYCYMPFSVSSLENAIKGIKGLNIRGCGVSMPYKLKVISLLDEIDSDVKEIGSVNTIVNTNGILKGCNTDYYGVCKALENLNIQSKHTILLVGAGGIAKAIIYALTKKGFKKIKIANRTNKKAKDIAHKYSIDFIDFKQINLLPFDLLINATSVGMFPNKEDCIFEETQIKRAKFIIDVPTNPLETELCKIARSFDCKVIPGHFISLYQAAKQFELYTGHVPPLETMHEALKNIVQ